MSAAKQKGTRWETALVRSLSGFFRGRYGLAPRRVAQEGFADTGDLHGLDPFVAQAKDWKSWEAAMREGLDGAVVQARRAGRAYGVAFVKRARRPVGEGYAVLRIEDFARLLLRLRRYEEAIDSADNMERTWRGLLDETAQDLAESFPSSSSSSSSSAATVSASSEP